MEDLAIVINDENVYEYSRAVSLDKQQQAFLDKMDADMENGIKVQGKLIENPDHLQRGKFVVMNLIKALQQDNDSAISVSCAYLVSRFFSLSEIHISDCEDGLNIEFVDKD